MNIPNAYNLLILQSSFKSQLFLPIICSRHLMEGFAIATHPRFYVKDKTTFSSSDAGLARIIRCSTLFPAVHMDIDDQKEDKKEM